MIEVTDESFDALVIRSECPVVVDFWAPWCRPCESVTRILEQLEVEHGTRVAFAKLDVDANPAVASRYGVLSIPMTILFQGGEPRAEVAGARPRRHFEKVLAPWL